MSPLDPQPLELVPGNRWL